MKKNYLKIRRKQLGLTMLEVANAVGVSESTVSRWESGNIENMRMEKVYLLAEVLHASPLWVMGLPIENIDKEMTDKLISIADDYVNTTQNFFDEYLNIKNKVISISNLLHEINDLSSEQISDVIKYISFLKTKK